MVISYHKGTSFAYHKKFIKDSKKLISAQQQKLLERLVMFGKDEFNPVLNNHALKGKYQGFRSINISGDLRAVYKRSLPSSDGKRASDSVIFVAIDSHSNLYG